MCSPLNAPNHTASVFGHMPSGQFIIAYILPFVTHILCCPNCPLPLIDNTASPFGVPSVVTCNSLRYCTKLIRFAWMLIHCNGAAKIAVDVAIAMPDQTKKMFLR